MKKTSLLVIVSLLITACAGSIDSRQGERFGKNQTSTVNEDWVADDTLDTGGFSNETSSDESNLSKEVECYPDGIHPIGKSIAEQFDEITTYKEVMNWFCNGAEFVDILNALLTQELIDIEAEIFLIKIAGGSTWDEIWLELGITEQ
jgi:hypothetical protein